jgi:hypothetical protein
METNPAALHEQLIDARNRLEQAWDATDDETGRVTIVDQMAQIDRQVMRLVADQIDQHTAAFTKAAAALGEANAKLEAALADAEGVAAAVEAVARALQLVAEVV